MGRPRLEPPNNLGSIRLDQRLAKLLGKDVVAAAEPPAPSGRQDIKKLSLSHDELITLLLANPFKTHREIAAFAGYTESWLSRIIASDCFQVRLAERLEKEVEPERRAAIRAHFASVEELAQGSLRRCLELMAERLDKPSEGIADQFLIKSTEMHAKLLGYGARVEPTAPPVNLQVHLHTLGDNMVRLLRSKRADVIEGETAPGASPGGTAENENVHKAIAAPAGAVPAPAGS